MKGILLSTFIPAISQYVIKIPEVMPIPTYQYLDFLNTIAMNCQLDVGENPEVIRLSEPQKQGFLC